MDSSLIMARLLNFEGDTPNIDWQNLDDYLPPSIPFPAFGSAGTTSLFPGSPSSLFGFSVGVVGDASFLLEPPSLLRKEQQHPNYPGVLRFLRTMEPSPFFSWSRGTTPIFVCHSFHLVTLSIHAFSSFSRLYISASKTLEIMTRIVLRRGLG